MLYNFLKLIVQIALRVFFKRLTVNDQHRLKVDGPLIIVANHPNTFMDPIVIAAFLRQQVHFLANGSLFNTSFKRWMLSQINMVPIYRKEDSGGESPDNREVFKKCYEFLKSGGTLIIFPEGSSVNERRLRKLKTGTARIALGAEQEYNFELGLKILTIGLNYSDARRFRSNLLVNADEVIRVADYQGHTEKDDFKAAQLLTSDIGGRLEAHTIVTKNQADDVLAQRIETVYKTPFEETSGHEVAQEDFRITKNIVEAIHYFQDENPALVQEVDQELEQYFAQLNRLQIKDQTVANEAHKKFFPNAFLKFLYTIFGFPFYVLGLIGNYIPYIIPSKVANVLTKEVEYIAPIMMVVGIFTFPIYYGLLIYCCYHFTTSGLFTILTGLLLPISGFFVLHYWNHLITTQNHFLVFAIFRQKNKLVEGLVNRRKRILTLLDHARETYVRATEGKKS